MKASMLHTTLWLFGGMLPLAPLTAISLTFNMMKHYHSLIDRWSKSFQVNPGVPHVSQPFMQDSLWQCFLAWRAASRPVHPSALHLLHFGQVSRAVLYSIAALSNLLSWNVLSSEDHQSSIRCDLWTFWSVRGGGPSVHSSGCQDNSGSEIGVQQKGQSRVKIL